MDEHLEAVLRDNGLEEGKDAQEFFDALDDDKKESYREEARDDRLISKLKPQFEGVERNITKKMHTRLDALKIPQSPGRAGAGKPDPKPAAGGDPDPDPSKKKDPPVIPEGYVTKEEFDGLKGQLKDQRVRQECVEALAGQKFMSDAASADAIDALSRDARENDRKQIVIQREVVENGETVLRELSLKSAVDELKKLKPYLFAADVRDGGGAGAGSAGGASEDGTWKIPKGTTYPDLQADPNLMQKALDNDPEGYIKIKTDYYGGDGDDVMRTISGQGKSAMELARERKAAAAR